MNLGRIADATCNADERIATQQAMPRSAKAGIHKFLITNSRQMSSLVVNDIWAFITGYITCNTKATCSDTNLCNERFMFK
jgi:hypothetical protein